MGNAAPGGATESGAEAPHSHHAEGLGNIYIGQEKKRDPNLLLRIIYVVKCILTILFSICVISVTVSTAIAIKIFTSDQSGRLVAMIVLSVTAAVTLSMSIYAMVAILKKHTKPVHLTSVVLIVIIIIEIIIISVSVRVSDSDELNISRSLSESYKLAREDNPRHVRIWENLQHDLVCCGVYGPEDYSNGNIPPYFAPDIPISCCPGYDHDRSELVQERERLVCKMRHEYYDVGCRDPLLEMFKHTAKSVIGITAAHIILMVLMATYGAVISRRRDIAESKTQETPDSSTPELPIPSKSVNKGKTNAKV